MGNTDTPFMYNGRDGVVTDANGLLYMRARYYSPDLMRFVNAVIVAGDISNAITLNRYAYANDNPVSNIDPLGLSAKRESSSWWNGVTNWFGAGVTFSSSTKRDESVYKILFVNYKTGVEKTTIEKSLGDSSKPISVYSDVQYSNPIISSSAGIKYNVGDLTTKYTLGLDELGSSMIWKDSSKDIAISFAANLSELKLEAKLSKTEDNETRYHEIEVDIGAVVIIAYALTHDLSCLQSFFGKTVYGN